ncbi:MAG: LysR family transcriptional regulator [Candidatus Delongbacteria bacterium]|jgi:molybdate transport repressor ModE-like protein|nr:LysR family transcriptional regulator [Candidatus Delongbacteria bacterium]
MSKSEQKIKFNFKIWLETENSTGIMGLTFMKLLKEIDSQGTLNHAIESMGLHYRKTWDKIKQIEKILGFKIIFTHRGGTQHGNTELTSEGRILVDMLENIYFDCQIYFTEKCKIATEELNKKIRKISS